MKRDAVQDEPLNEPKSACFCVPFSLLGADGFSFDAWPHSLILSQALLAGNAVLYKPSEWSLQTGRRVAELMAEARVPSDFFAPVFGDGAGAGSALAAQPLDLQAAWGASAPDHG